MAGPLINVFAGLSRKIGENCIGSKPNLAKGGDKITSICFMLRVARLSVLSLNNSRHYYLPTRTTRCTFMSTLTICHHPEAQGLMSFTATPQPRTPLLVGVLRRKSHSRWWAGGKKAAHLPRVPVRRCSMSSVRSRSCPLGAAPSKSLLPKLSWTPGNLQPSILSIVVRPYDFSG